MLSFLQRRNISKSAITCCSSGIWCTNCLIFSSLKVTSLLPTTLCVTLLIFIQLKVPAFIYRHLHGKLNSRGLQFEVTYWPALAVGSVAQLVAARCPNGLWTRSLPLDRPTCAPSQPQLWPSPRNVLQQVLTIFTSEYYQVLLATLEGWKAELSVIILFYSSEVTT